MGGGQLCAELGSVVSTRCTSARQLLNSSTHASWWEERRMTTHILRLPQRQGWWQLVGKTSLLPPGRPEMGLAQR